MMTLPQLIILVFCILPAYALEPCLTGVYKISDADFVTGTPLDGWIPPVLSLSFDILPTGDCQVTFTLFDFASSDGSDNEKFTAQYGRSIPAVASVEFSNTATPGKSGTIVRRPTSEQAEQAAVGTFASPRRILKLRYSHGADCSITGTEPLSKDWREYRV
ncbi:hypothetical protein FOZ60_014099 [Perkinsus olseni]|uniref:Uncharacterized protein n=1 Tax=Perkinsus olseni TaxID=32597 RepID=A0A7J6P7R7_PEROL|nr:hypothetical protein FOZ60_014099 [Perkinsus olseni]